MLATRYGREDMLGSSMGDGIYRTRMGMSEGYIKRTIKKKTRTYENTASKSRCKAQRYLHRLLTLCITLVLLENVSYNNSEHREHIIIF